MSHGVDTGECAPHDTRVSTAGTHGKYVPELIIPFASDRYTVSSCSLYELYGTVRDVLERRTFNPTVFLQYSTSFIFICFFFFYKTVNHIIVDI